MTGTNVLRFRLKDAARSAGDRLRAAGRPDVSITANGAAIPAEAVNGHLVIPARHLKAGENTVQVRFRAGEAPLNRSADLLYTLFVPARARQALPCFDQPDLKGRWTVTLEHPGAMAIGRERRRARADGRR